MIVISERAVRLALRNCVLDAELFGEQLPLYRKIKPFYSRDSWRCAWGYSCGR